MERKCYSGHWELVKLWLLGIVQTILNVTVLLPAVAGFYRKGVNCQGCLLDLLMLMCIVSLLYLCSVLNHVVTAIWRYCFCDTLLCLLSTVLYFIQSLFLTWRHLTSLFSVFSLLNHLFHKFEDVFVLMNFREPNNLFCISNCDLVQRKGAQSKGWLCLETL